MKNRFHHLVLRILNSAFLICVILFLGCEAGNGPSNDFDFGTMTDIDGNEYNTIQIGSQTWMAEDLRVTHYRNGDAIPNITNDATWGGLATGAFCYYNNDAGNAETYGCLYNWHAVNDSRDIAPEGWHVATDAEWQTLVDYLGGFADAGGKMKEAGTSHWESPNNSATNESGFTGLPSGHRDNAGEFLNLGYIAYYWTATANGTLFAWGRKLYNTVSMVDHISIFKTYGYSIRCVQDI